MAQAPTRANWISIALLGVIWGGTFMVTTVALRGYGPLTVACARTTLGAVATLALMIAMRRPLPKGAQAWQQLAIIGIINTALPFVLLSWGLQHVPSAFAGISMSALPLFVLPLAHVFTDEKMHLRRLIGVIIGFCGALVLIGPGLAQLGQGSEPLAQLACLASTVSYAIASIMTRRAPPMDPIALTAMTLVAGSVVLVPITLAVEGVPHWAGREAGLAILFLGLVPTGLAALLRTLVIRSAGSVFMTLVNYQVPLWSVVFGALFLNEALPLRFFVALGLILTGIAVSQWRSLMGVLRR
ncbi:MAG: EamA family transporter [Rhodobacterales bacterium]|nr:MAG: EamA family transporter [Rhodobacterales bacterium]